jgi:deferrochelatase/peroxidase EfeB
LSESNSSETKITRREWLKISALAGAGVAVGASGLGALSLIGTSTQNKKSKANTLNEAIPFHGSHQAGVVTPQQTYCYFVSFDVLTNDKKELIKLFKKWTTHSDQLSRGELKTSYSNAWLPPNDSGEVNELDSSKLTITYGVGPNFFKKDGVDRFGIASKRPNHLKDIPKMPRDDLNKDLSGGDLCIQVCANHQQVAFHAIRNLIKDSLGVVQVKWMQSGFMNAPKGQTGRNLFGFKDGTANRSTEDGEGHHKIIWADSSEPKWMKNGTYLAVRKIKMFLDVWDRSSLKDQEDTFGRKKDTGAPYGKAKEHDEVQTINLPSTSHVALAKKTKQEIHRRAYSFTDGIENDTGHLNAGLFFISFQKNPDQQLIPMLKVMSEQDKLNEYTKHVGSAMFACPGGTKPGHYIAQTLLEP